MDEGESERLKSKIEEAINKNYSEKAIKNLLLQNGYTAEETFKILSTLSKYYKQKKIQEDSKKSYKKEKI